MSSRRDHSAGSVGTSSKRAIRGRPLLLVPSAVTPQARRPNAFGPWTASLPDPYPGTRLTTQEERHGATHPDGRERALDPRRVDRSGRRRLRGRPAGVPRAAGPRLHRDRSGRPRERCAGPRAAPRGRPGDPAPADRRRLSASAPALSELGQVPWRERADARWLARHGRWWRVSTALYTAPLAVGSVAMVIFEPITLPVALATAAHAWMIPELYAFRGASVVRPKGPRNAAAEPVAQGLLADLLGHEARELQRETGLALEPGELGTWLVGEAGALLVTGRRGHCFCVRTTEPELPPSDRVAHLLLALREDEEGFATVANHAFAGAAWRVRRRLPKRMRPALSAAREVAS